MSLSAILVNLLLIIVVTKVLLSDRELDDNGLLVHCDMPWNRLWMCDGSASSKSGLLLIALYVVNTNDYLRIAIG